ncbi:MAG: HAMP domain-containing sensor histidine kinase [Ignavibacteria bacterium]|nr:HAMP domain-containing sensor histidine kinase [Ignavibacteria bacterium]
MKNRIKNQTVKKTSLEEKPSPFGNFYNQLFGEYPFPVLVIDSEDFSIKNANKAAYTFYKYNNKDFLKLKLTDIDVSVKAKSKSQIFRYYKRKRFNARHKLKNGIERDVEIVNCLVTEQNKQFFFLTLIKTDGDNHSISEKEKQLEDLKLRFLSTSSHEFRTPLTTILTSSEVLLMVGRIISDEKYVDYIIQIQNAVVYMTRLLDDIITINKTEIGKWKFSPTNIDLFDFFVKMINEARNNASPRHNINLLYEMQNKQAIVDNKLLHHILSNLLSNAVKYSPNGGEITLKVRGTKSEIEFIVSDNGIGISKHDQNKLFETFFRGENTGAIEGTGLGLSIVKRCVESHGGKINFKSQLNKGTTFIVSVPMMTLV